MNAAGATVRSDDWVERVREATDIVELISQSVTLKCRPELDRPVPVPRREDAVVLGQRRAPVLSLLRLQGRR